MPAFTPTQGRYLAFIKSYINLYEYSPAESEIARALSVKIAISNFSETWEGNVMRIHGMVIGAILATLVVARFALIGVFFGVGGLFFYISVNESAWEKFSDIKQATPVRYRSFSRGRSSPGSRPKPWHRWIIAGYGLAFSSAGGWMVYECYRRKTLLF